VVVELEALLLDDEQAPSVSAATISTASVTPARGTGEVRRSGVW